MRRAAFFALASSLALSTAGLARAGALDRFEDAHAPPSSPSNGGSSGSSSSSSSSSSTSSSSDPWSSSSSSSSTSKMRLPPEIAFLCVPAFWGVVFAPPNVPTLDPYDGLWIENPKPHLDASGAVRTPYVPESRVRHLEVTVGGFLARDEQVFARTLGLRLFLGPMVLTSSWDRMYETPPEPGALARLDYWRFHLSSNLLGGLARNVEIFPHMGAALMKGKRATWAFDAGLEARVYPWRPLAISASSIASIFKHGPALFDTRVEAGVAFERFELRAGVRWWWQHRAQGFAGPTATFVARF